MKIINEWLQRSMGGQLTMDEDQVVTDEAQETTH